MYKNAKLEIVQFFFLTDTCSFLQNWSLFDTFKIVCLLFFQLIQMKIDHNPFAKGFRDKGSRYVNIKFFMIFF